MKKKLMLIVVLFFSLIASATIVTTRHIIFYCPICATKYTINDWVVKDSVFIYTCSNCGSEKVMNEEEFNETVRKLEKTLADQNESKSETSVK